MLSLLRLLLFVLIFVQGKAFAKNITQGVSIQGSSWFMNGQVINKGSAAEGLLMNVRMVNAVFEDRSQNILKYSGEFNPQKNTDNFISTIPGYISSGVNGFTISLQGGMPGYEGAINSAFNNDGSLRAEYMLRVEKVIRACAKSNSVVILSCFYQRQHSHQSSLENKQAIINAVKNTAKWIKRKKFGNVLLEISNEYRHEGFVNWKAGDWLTSDEGQIELIRYAKAIHPSLPISTSGMGDGTYTTTLANAVDFITLHFNNTAIQDYKNRIRQAKQYNKPVLCNEDEKTGHEGAKALYESVINGCGWGFMHVKINQTIPFSYNGKPDDSTVYNMMNLVTSQTRTNVISLVEKDIYFPQPDHSGGWRQLSEPVKVKEVTGIDVSKLDETFEFIKGSTKNGGLLILKDGWLVYEKYFGKGHRDATPNTASCAKSFTSICAGILISEYPELFPEGLDQKVYTPRYFPGNAFPLPDQRMKEIKLGQLLSFTGGIRGNNPVYVNGVKDTIRPIGPDGFLSMIDEYALGRKEGVDNGTAFSTQTLWCEPGKGYSYASASIHNVSIIIRKVSGTELQDYIDTHIAKPLGWGTWGYGYKYAKEINHTPGAGGIAVRATDMLRFGYLLLNEGRWNNRQLVPADYVRMCSQVSPYNPHYPYSLQFKVNTNGYWPQLPRDAYWKQGSGNHCLYIVPSLNLVIWKLGGRDGQYSAEDTGIEFTNNDTHDNRDGWKPLVDDETAVIKTLEMVISSISR